MSKRSRRRRALASGAPSWRPGFGPGEPPGPGGSSPGTRPPDDPPEGGGGVREPRRPKPVPPSFSMEAPPPEPPLRARDRTLPLPDEAAAAIPSR
ncbi:hypothetical protein ACFFV7_29240 [Nonomuraea spiralis]|uniref:Uncharacterized protein n=1 Tax=Nonomuraea spiralis TaxID=46182 RepID=A0ABV5IL96_9ACTN|nr:hypothetical protein [Nonomuraea spiralis]GGT23006.1 hypothetical protein GCM10010176_079450 [Nonomuraea spiralis]